MYPGNSYPQPTGAQSAGPARPDASQPQNQPAASHDKLDGQWVEAIEDIVRKTSNDPFRRSQELMKLKAAYLQDRYGKNMKTL